MAQCNIHQPLGFDQGDPLVICRSSHGEDLCRSFAKLQIKAYYCGRLSALCGRRFGKVIIDVQNLEMSSSEFAAYWRWIAESVMTSTSVGGVKVIFV